MQAYPGGTVSLMVQVEDWVAMHMDPNLEREAFVATIAF